MDKSLYALSTALIGLVAFASAPASATCGGDPVGDTDTVWECLEGRSSATGNYVNLTDGDWHGPFTFKGVANMHHPVPGNITGCTLTVVGDVQMDGNDVNIRVNSATSSGPGSCGNVTFAGFPWTASINGAAPSNGDVFDRHTGITFGDLHGIVIRYPFFGLPITACSGTLENVEFGNDTAHTSKTGPSYFDFAGVIPGLLGDCTVNGLLPVIDNGTWSDVNVW